MADKKMVKKKIDKNKMDAENKQDSVLFAFLATFLLIVGFLIAVIARKKDKYVMYYAKQSLVIFVMWVIAGTIGNIFDWFIAGRVIEFSLNALMFLIWVLSWAYALSGKIKEIPIVSDWAKKIDL